MNYRLVELNSTSDLRASAALWDGLWERSETSLPTLQAEMLAQWVEHFAPDGDLRCLAVKQGDRFVAGLPLVGTMLWRTVPAAGLPCNDWMACGDLLLDDAADRAAVLDVLVSGMAQLPCPLVWLEDVAVDSPRCGHLLSAIQRAGLAYEVHERYRVGLTDVSGDWEQFDRTLSKNLRRNLKKSIRNLRRRGNLEFQLHETPRNGALESMLRRAFEVEDRSWKGGAGTSVLRAPGMFDYLVAQASDLVRRQQFRLSFLQLDGLPIAFAYGWQAKSVYHSYKIGYDGAFASFGPGHVLDYFQFEEFHRRADVKSCDYLGPLNEANARWASDSYAVGRVVIAPRRWQGQILLSLYKATRPMVRRLRDIVTRRSS